VVYEHAGAVNQGGAGRLDVRDARPVVAVYVIRLGPNGDAQWDEIRDRLSRLPGIGNFARAMHVVPDLDSIADAVAARLGGIPNSEQSFG
jgi:adenylyl- and sulfurtransferase ThiI